MSKTESNIAIFLLYLFIFLAAGMSYVTSERVAALDEKIQLREIIVHPDGLISGSWYRDKKIIHA